MQNEGGIMSKLEALQKLYPFEIQEVGSKTIQEIGQQYHALLKEGKEQGFVPLYVVYDEILEEKIEMELEVRGNDSVMDLAQGFIQKAENMTAQDFFDSVYEEFESEYQELLEEEGSYTDIREDAFDEDWAPEEGEKVTLELASLIPYGERKTKKDLFLVKLPQDKAYQALAYFSMGGFNDCPMPHEQVAVCKYWYEKYGAIPAAISYDTVEFFVEKPVNTVEGAKELTIEQHLFCSDLGTQILEDLEEVGNFIYKNLQWFFWWD